MSFPKPLRHRLEYIVFRAAQAAATALPLEAVSWSSGLAWRLIAPRLHRQERALRNLALAYPELSEAERKRIAAGMWENLGRTFGESFHLREIVAEKRIRFEPMEQLEEIIRGGPCVVCGLHLGNWELVAYASKLMGAQFTGVYQRLSNPLVDEETRKLRAFLYEGGLLPKTPVTRACAHEGREERRLSRVPGRPPRRQRRSRAVLRKPGARDRISRSARP